MKVAVYGFSRYAWCMGAFVQCAQSYWREPMVAGFDEEVEIPKDWEFVKVKKQDAKHWSIGFLEFIRAIDSELIVIMFEDYLLTRTVDMVGVKILERYMEEHTNVARLDLTADRLHGRGMKDVESYDRFDIIACDRDAPYEFSFQAAIWRKSALLEVVAPNRSPWDIEIYTSFKKSDWLVRGTRQWPVRYCNLLNGGRISRSNFAKLHPAIAAELSPKIPSDMAFTD